MDHPVQTASLTDAISEVAHPLDPLSAREIARATATIRAHFTWGDDLRVETIDIEEPTKEFARNHVQGTPFPRIARFNIYRRGEMGVWQGRTDLASGEVIAKTFRADARAMVAVEEVLLIEQTVKPIRAFRKRCVAEACWAKSTTCASIRGPWDNSSSKRSRADGSSTASSGCVLFHWTTTTPTPSRGCTR
jgi:Cu2+-containing amine oxidase